MGRAFWIVVGAVVAGVLALALTIGPVVYRHGKDLVGPIMDLAESEETFAALDAELGWTEPEDGRIPADRLETFLAVRRQLLPAYERWAELEERVEESGTEDLEAAKEVLAGVRTAFEAQEEALREHGMSPAEFRWLERTVYRDWLGATRADELVVRVQETTREDLRFVEEQRRVHGDSAALEAVAGRLETRLAELAQDRPEGDSGGLPAATRQLLEAHRSEIERLDFASYDTVHDRFWQTDGSVAVTIGE